MGTDYKLNIISSQNNRDFILIEIEVFKGIGKLDFIFNIKDNS